jgi:uncharacterized protein (TIGR02757 family)
MQKQMKVLKQLLDNAYLKYATEDFIPHDPVQVLFDYTDTRDREIAGLLAATFAWGKRSIILNKLGELFSRMDHAPADFVMETGMKKYKALNGFKHRTFLPEDLKGFLQGIQNIYLHHGGLKPVFCHPPDIQTAWMLPADSVEWNPWAGIQHFRNLMLEDVHFLPRTAKHISHPIAKSSCKRLHMYLRWMVRKDSIDTGLWSDTVSQRFLRCPLDVHTGRVARNLGLLSRKADDALAVEELTFQLRILRPDDPIAYDLALFGLGVSGDYLLP